MKTTTKRNLLTRILTWVPPVLVISQFFSFMGINTRVYFLLAGLGAVFPFLCKAGNRNKPVCQLLLGFALYGIGSVILFAINNVDLKAWLVELLVFILPMGFFAAGSCEYNSGLHFEESFWLALSASFIVGFYLYFTAPSWYAQRLATIWSNSWYRNSISESAVLQYSRFSGIFGSSYAISYFGLAALSMSFCSFLHPSSPRIKKIGGLAVIACWLACILCQQRIAMVCSTLIVLLHLLYGQSLLENARKIVMIMIPVVLFAILAQWVAQVSSERFDHVGNQLATRWQQIDFDQAIGGRTWQYKSVMENWDAVGLGYGLGSGGAYVRAHGGAGVTDGQYVKMLYEQGVVGVTWLGIILLCTIGRGLRHFRQFRFELGTVVFFCLAGIGSNTLCINALYSIAFWYSLGRIWNRAELKRRELTWTTS